jgi:hypothetical protein
MTPPVPVHILLPCLDEERSIEPMVAALSKTFAGDQSFRVTAVFIDDGSHDDTWREIERVRRGEWAVGVGGIRLEHHQGKGVAQAIGIRALASEPGMIVLMDSDGQHDPSPLPSALHACEASKLPQVARRTDYQRRRTSMLGTLGLSVFAGLTGVRFDPTLGEYLVLPHRTVRLLADNPQLGITPLVPLVQASVTRVETFSAPVLERSDGSQSTRWTKGQLWHKAILMLLANPWAMLPRLALTIAVTIALLGAYGLGVGIHSVLNGTFLGVGSILVVTVLVFSVLAGLQMMTLGLLVVMFRTGIHTGTPSAADAETLDWSSDRA